MGNTSDVNSLSLSHRLLTEIVDHCRDGHPFEACGLVLGNRGRAEQVRRMRNVHPKPERHYLMDDKEQLTVFRAMRAAGQELVAIFHSHPSTPAYPSSTDIDLAFYPKAVYLIVSTACNPPDIQGFRIDRDQRTVRPVPIRVYDEV